MTRKKKMTIVSTAASTAILAAIVAGAVATTLVGCGRVENARGTNDAESAKSTSNAWTQHGRGCCTKVVEIEGHKYILLDGTYSDNTIIIHAASCGCMNK